MRQVSLVKFSNICLLIGTIASRNRIDNSSLSEPDPQIIDLRPPGHDLGGRERAPRLNGKPLGEALLRRIARSARGAFFRDREPIAW